MSRRYGYKMYNCSLAEWNKYKDRQFHMKKNEDLAVIFGFMEFDTVETAQNKINSVFIPFEHGLLPRTTWTLSNDKILLVKEIAFENNNDSILYQNAVEKAWALGGHLDPRVIQIYYE